MIKLILFCITFCFVFLIINTVMAQKGHLHPRERDSAEVANLFNPKSNVSDFKPELKQNNTTNDVDKSFRYANWALATLAIILALFGIISLIYYLVDRTNHLMAVRLRNEINEHKKEIIKLKKSLLRKVEFNYTAAQTNFQSMEYLTQMVLLQNPEIDKDKYFLTMINENRAVLSLYHQDKDSRKRALKELRYNGTTSCIETLKKYKSEIKNKEIVELTDKAIDEINKRKGAMDALNKK